MSQIKSDPFFWSWFATRECVLEFACARKMYLVCIQPTTDFKIQMAKGHVNSVLFVKNMYCTFFSGLSLSLLRYFLRENDKIKKT